MEGRRETGRGRQERDGRRDTDGGIHSWRKDFTQAPTSTQKDPVRRRDSPKFTQLMPTLDGVIPQHAHCQILMYVRLQEEV